MFHHGKPRGFCQPCANAFAQLFGGGIGEGHHRIAAATARARNPRFAAMAKDQAQIQAEMVKVLPVPALASIS
jgi:hypothetical protein